jgi:hypothetical protein
MNSFGMPEPFSVREFLNELSRYTGRAIVLHPVAPEWCGGARWSGAWLATRTTDHIVFVREAWPVRNAQTVLHEAAHILFGHTGEPLPPDIELPGVDMSSVVRGRGRTSYDSREELEAEAFSSLVLESAMLSAQADLELSDDPRVNRLTRRLG